MGKLLSIKRGKWVAYRTEKLVGDQAGKKEKKDKKKKKKKGRKKDENGISISFSFTASSFEMSDHHEDWEDGDRGDVY